MIQIQSPFVVAIDTREQQPYAFEGLKADAREKRRPLVVQTARTTLLSGDYSIIGKETEIAIERKSLADLYGTLGQGRERFERELNRLSHFRLAVVMIEAPWSRLLQGYERSNLAPKTVLRSIIAWQNRFGAVHWWTAGRRDLAEVFTYRILERYWRDSRSIGE